ncbi:MAG: RNA polymerase sigma factor [Pirellulales bacterium]
MDSTSPTLLRRVRDKADNDAWERFVQLYTPLLVLWSRRAGLSESDTSDLVQEVLTLLLRKLPDFQYDGQGTFRGWLRTVTLNKWRELQRKRKESPLGHEDNRLEELSDDSSVGFWERDYQQFLVGRALELMQSHFEPATWRACLLTISEGRPTAEVATELGISEASVYQARSRVLRRLREELAELLE